MFKEGKRGAKHQYWQISRVFCILFLLWIVHEILRAMGQCPNVLTSGELRPVEGTGGRKWVFSWSWKVGSIFWGPGGHSSTRNSHKVRKQKATSKWTWLACVGLRNPFHDSWNSSPPFMLAETIEVVCINRDKFCSQSRTCNNLH